ERVTALTLEKICGAPTPTLHAVRLRKDEACHMTASNYRRQVALPDPDPSIALAQTAREEFERELLARQPTVDQLIERAKKDRAEFIAGLLRRFAARLKSFFRVSAHPTTSASFDTQAAYHSSNRVLLFTTTENTMDHQSTEATDIHRSDAESLTFRQPSLLSIVIALPVLGVIICLICLIYLLPSSLFVDTVFDLTFSYP